jgi:hypothetical protein
MHLSEPVLDVSNKLHSILYTTNDDSEPLLIMDRIVPSRLFLVRFYVGGGGEFSRPLYKRELTGYDYESGLVYPTQTERLDTLQSLIESQTYGSSDTFLSRIAVRNSTTRETLTLKATISKILVEELVALYEFAW